MRCRCGNPLLHACGSFLRLILWISFPPLGWYARHRARERRRWHAVVRAHAAAGPRRIQVVDTWGRPLGPARWVNDAHVTEADYR